MIYWNDKCWCWVKARLRANVRDYKVIMAFVICGLILHTLWHHMVCLYSSAEQSYILLRVFLVIGKTRNWLWQYLSHQCDLKNICIYFVLVILFIVNVLVRVFVEIKKVYVWLRFYIEAIKRMMLMPSTFAGYPLEPIISLEKTNFNYSSAVNNLLL